MDGVLNRIDRLVPDRLRSGCDLACVNGTPAALHISDRRSSIASWCAFLSICIYLVSPLFPLELPVDLPLLFLALSAIASAVAARGSLPDLRRSGVLSIVPFLVSLAISIVLSSDIRRSAMLSLMLLPSVLIYFLILGSGIRAGSMRTMFIVFSVIGACLSSVLLWARWSVGGYGPLEWVRMANNSVIVVPNDVTFLAVIVPLSLALIVVRPSKPVIALSSLSVFLSICAIVSYWSRVGTVTMMAGLICFAAFFSPRKAILTGIIVLAGMAALDALLGFPLVSKFIRHWDGSGRIPLWLCAWDMFLDAPLFGQGPHTFVHFYVDYLRTVSFPEWLFVDRRAVPWAHNLYAETLGEQGLFGLASLLLVLMTGLLSAWKARTTFSGETKVFSQALFAGLVGFCAASVFELTFIRQWVSIVLFSLSAMAVSIRHRGYGNSEKEKEKPQ